MHVRREVVEVITPGLVGDPEAIESAQELCLAALAVGEELGLAVLDASTGDFRATRIERGADDTELPLLLTEGLRRIAPRGLLVASGLEDSFETQLSVLLPGAVRTVVAPESFDPEASDSVPDGFDASANDAATQPYQRYRSGLYRRNATSRAAT